MKPTNDPSLRCCPRCVQQDAVRQVSHVVAKGRGTVSEFGLARSMGAGESYWVGSGGILVSDLAAPLDPQLRRPWSVLWTVLGAIAVFWLGAPAVGCAALALLTVPGWPCGVSAGLAVAGCALVLLAGVPLLHLPAALREQPAWTARQAQGAARWDRLYYYSRPWATVNGSGTLRKIGSLAGFVIRRFAPANTSASPAFGSVSWARNVR